MNVTVLGRICPSIGLGNDSASSFSSQANTQAHPSFQTLYQQGDSNRAVYNDSVLSMVGLCGAGFNCSVLCFGESGSGKSYTLAGEGTGQPGIVQMVIKDLFQEVDQLNSNGTLTYVKIGMYEIYNEVIHDLLDLDQQAAVCELGTSAQDGVYVKNLTEIAVSSASDAVSAFASGRLAQNSQNTDFGQASSTTAVVTRIHLTQEREEYGYPYKSSFTFVDLPGAEKLALDPNVLKRKEGALMNKSILALGQLIEDLANNPGAAPVGLYEASKLTNLLRDSLGGNCNTKVIVHQKPRSDPRVTKVIRTAARSFGNIVNFCLLNDTAAQGLIGQYRGQLLQLQAQQGSSTAPTAFDSDDLVGNNSKLVQENMKLKEGDAYLKRRLDQLDSRLADVAVAKMDLSRKLILAEEEKLKVSKILVDLQIQNNRIKEKASQDVFELNNKVMTLDSDYKQALINKERLAKEASLQRERLDITDRERQDLADKYITMKADYRALAKKYDNEVVRNQELGLELLTLLNAKVTLLKQEENLARASEHKRDETDGELQRARAIAKGLSSRKKRADEIGASDLDRQELQDKLFGKQEQLKTEYNEMRNQYHEQQERLQERIMELNAVLKAARYTTRECQHKLAQQEVELLSSREKAQELVVANSRLQTRLKEKNEELRSRLIKYLQDIAEFVDDRDATLNRKMEANLSNYVDSMTKDLKQTYKVREKQLSDAAREFKAKMKAVSEKHEKLLVAYRYLRKQLQNEDIRDIDLGPEEAELALKDDDVDSANRQEIRRLTEALKDAKRASVADDFQTQLGVFNSKTQHELEAERASLISTNAILGEQLAECHDYIDRYLNKYREENVALRRKLGMKERDGILHEDFPDPRGQRGGYPRHPGAAFAQPSWHY